MPSLLLFDSFPWLNKCFMSRKSSTFLLIIFFLTVLLTGCMTTWGEVEGIRLKAEILISSWETNYYFCKKISKLCSYFVNVLLEMSRLLLVYGWVMSLEELTKKNLISGGLINICGRPPHFLVFQNYDWAQIWIIRLYVGENK